MRTYICRTTENWIVQLRSTARDKVLLSTTALSKVQTDILRFLLRRHGCTQDKIGVPTFRRMRRARIESASKANEPLVSPRVVAIQSWTLQQSPLSFLLSWANGRTDRRTNEWTNERTQGTSERRVVSRVCSIDLNSAELQRLEARLERIERRSSLL